MIKICLTQLCSILKDKFLQEIAVVSIGNTFVSFLNFLYFFFAVRILSTEDYGTFNSLNSFLMFFVVAISPLGIIFTRCFSEYIAKKQFLTLKFVWKKLVKYLIVGAIMIFLLVSVFSSVVASFLHTDSMYIVICGVIIALSLISISFPPLFTSMQRFEIYSYVWIGSSLGRLICGALLMWFQFKVVGALAGFLAGPLCLSFVSLFFLPGLLKEIAIKKEKEDILIDVSFNSIFKFFLPSFIAMISFALLTTCDVFFVKHFFSAIDAGYYSIAQMVGKIVLLFLLSLSIVILPKATENVVNNVCSLNLIYKSLMIGGICCFLLTGGTFLFPEFILKILTSKVNSISVSLVGLFALSMSFYSLLWILINFLLVSHDVRLVLPLLFLAIGKVFVIYKYHYSLITILYILVLFSVVSVVVYLFIVLSKYKRNLVCGKF